MKEYFEIVDVQGREILDSRGNPTVEVEVTLDDDTVGRAAGGESSDHAAGQCDAGGQPDQDGTVGYSEKPFVVNLGSPYDNPVISEEESAQCGDRTDEIDESFVQTVVHCFDAGSYFADTRFPGEAGVVQHKVVATPVARNDNALFTKI